jgi:hypothetical protein
MQHDEKSGDWKMKLCEYGKTSVSTLDRLDQIRMSPSERQRARAYLRQAELLADILIRVDADLRLMFGFVGRGISAFAHRGKPPHVTPQPN